MDASEPEPGRPQPAREADPIVEPGDPPRRAPGIEANEAHGRVVLVRPDDGGFYLLDELGSRIWELCDGDHTFEQLVGLIGAELDRPASAIAGEVREWIAELRTEQLLLESD